MISDILIGIHLGSTANQNFGIHTTKHKYGAIKFHCQFWNTRFKVPKPFFVIWGPLVVPNNKVPTNTQCKPVGYDCRKFALCKRISTVWFGTQITMSNTKWTHVTTSVECLSQPKRIFPISPSKGLDEKNLFNTRRTSSSSFLSFQSVETPHHYSKHQVKPEPNRHVMSSLVQRCFFRKNKGKHICCKKCQRFGMHNLTLIYFPFCGSIKKNIFFYAAIKFQKIFLWFHKKIKIYKLFFYGSTKWHLFFLCCHKISKLFYGIKKSKYIIYLLHP